jgi:hypothetical protein
MFHPRHCDAAAATTVEIEKNNNSNFATFRLFFFSLLFLRLVLLRRLRLRLAPTARIPAPRSP